MSKVSKCESERVTFEHRHENKKVFQVFQVFNNIPGSQLLSDVQTFFSSVSLLQQFLKSYVDVDHLDRVELLLSLAASK